MFPITTTYQIKHSNNQPNKLLRQLIKCTLSLLCCIFTVSNGKKIYWFMLILRNSRLQKFFNVSAFFHLLSFKKFYYFSFFFLTKTNKKKSCSYHSIKVQDNAYGQCQNISTCMLAVWMYPEGGKRTTTFVYTWLARSAGNIEYGI